MIFPLLAQVVPPSELPAIRDIAPPLDVSPWPTWMIVCVIIGILCLLAIVGAAIFLVFRNRPKAPPPTPREIALGQLARLHPQADRESPYTFSISVSDVLRTYIGAEYHLHAREQTSPEFLGEIAQSIKFSRHDKELLAHFLERCDLIKFARIDSSIAENHELLKSATAFVEGERMSRTAVPAPS